MKPKSFSFSSRDGISLLGRVWVAPGDHPKGIVYLVHSLGEHSGRYDHVGNALAKAGYHLAAFDLRGHGLSKGRPGYAPSLAHLTDDMQVFIDEIKTKTRNNLPLFLYGHSFGANLVMHYCQRKSDGIRGVILSSPVFAMTMPHIRKKLAAAKNLVKILPGFKINPGVEAGYLSRNEAIVQAYQQDVYIQGKLSAQLWLNLLDCGQQTSAQAESWVLPTLLMHGSEDRFSLCSASQEFASKADGHVDFVCWDDYYHELHNDLGSEVVLERIIQWLDKHAF